MLNVIFTGEERGDYMLFGRMMAYFIVHRRPCPTFFSGLMYNLIAGVSCKPSISDVNDLETRAQLKMVCFKLFNFYLTCQELPR
jgi:hypothetical protein